MDIIIRQWIVFHIMVSTYTEINFTIEFVRSGIFIAKLSAGIYWIFLITISFLFILSFFRNNHTLLVIISNFILLRNYLPLIDIEDRRKFES